MSTFGNVCVYYLVCCRLFMFFRIIVRLIWLLPFVHGFVYLLLRWYWRFTVVCFPACDVARLPRTLAVITRPNRWPICGRAPWEASRRWSCSGSSATSISVSSTPARVCRSVGRRSPGYKTNTVGVWVLLWKMNGMRLSLIQLLMYFATFHISDKSHVVSDEGLVNWDCGTLDGPSCCFVTYRTICRVVRWAVTVTVRVSWLCDWWPRRVVFSLTLRSSWPRAVRPVRCRRFTTSTPWRWRTTASSPTPRRPSYAPENRAKPSSCESGTNRAKASTCESHKPREAVLMWVAQTARRRPHVSRTKPPDMCCIASVLRRSGISVLLAQLCRATVVCFVCMFWIVSNLWNLAIIQVALYFTDIPVYWPSYWNAMNGSYVHIVRRGCL